jgi:DNA replication protein DnaC
LSYPTFKFVAEGQNARIIGSPGTGKSHIAKAVAYQAALQGHNVRYLEAHGTFAAYAHGSDTEQQQQLRTPVDVNMLILDDLFLARRISDKVGELLQTLVYPRYKLKRSIVVTSNPGLQDWGKYLDDKTMATTVLDRLMHRANILEFEGKSYRLKETAKGPPRRNRSAPVAE